MVTTFFKIDRPRINDTLEDFFNKGKPFLCLSESCRGNKHGEVKLKKVTYEFECEHNCGMRTKITLE